jgi:poly(3-hydroxybutyrate) depolymerase
MGGLQMDVKRFPEKMGDLPIDFSNPKRTLVSGLFEEKAKVNGSLRGFLTYIPEDLDYCQPCLVAAIPSAEKAEEYLETSGFKAFADEKKLFLHLATPEAGEWKQDGSDADYLNAVYVAIQARDYYITMQDNIYLCGIGDASFAAHQAARRMASEWSGLMTFGDLDGDLKAEHSVLHGESDQGEVELKVMGMAAQLPVWMSMTAKNADNTAAVDFWKEQNHVVGAPLSGEGADEIWMPTPVRVLSEVNEEQIAQVRLAVRKNPFTKEQMEAAWSYIGLARRHRGPGKKQLRYFKEPIACGAEKKTMEVDGMTRTWYEYVPKSCTPDQKWPLVVVFHGRGGTAETFFDLSCVSTVAEERHFIAVVPEAGVYQQKPNGLRNVLLWCGIYQDTPVDDVKFIRELVADVESRHSVDKSRVYAMGQSSGGMMSDLLAYTAGDIFAAVAPWSALRCPSKMYREWPACEQHVPTMMIYGDQDFLTAGHGEDPLLPVCLSEELRATLMEKLNKYQLDPTNVETWKTEPITWYAFPDKQGVPMVVIGRVDNMVHANYPEESWISYDQFLSQFHRSENGTLYYRGRPVNESDV